MSVSVPSLLAELEAIDRDLEQRDDFEVGDARRRLASTIGVLRLATEGGVLRLATTEGLPVSDQPTPVSGQPLDAHTVAGASAARGVLVSNLLCNVPIPVQLDELGRVARTPAIERLILFVRQVAAKRDAPGCACFSCQLTRTLEEVDAEAAHMGQSRPDSRETVPAPNKEVASGVEAGLQTRKPAIKRASGAERPCQGLSPADLERTDRQCKK